MSLSIRRFSYLALRSAARRGWCAFDADACASLQSILKRYECTSYTSYRSLNFQMEGRYQAFLSLSLFSIRFFYFFLPSRSLLCKLWFGGREWQRKFACKKRKRAEQRFSEWFLRTVESARGACAWRALKICGYSKLVAPPGNRSVVLHRQPAWNGERIFTSRNFFRVTSIRVRLTG